jgi:hypothetical protein
MAAGIERNLIDADIGVAEGLEDQPPFARLVARRVDVERAVIAVDDADDPEPRWSGGDSGCRRERGGKRRRGQDAEGCHGGLPCELRKHALAAAGTRRAPYAPFAAVSDTYLRRRVADS